MTTRKLSCITLKQNNSKSGNVACQKLVVLKTDVPSEFRKNSTFGGFCFKQIKFQTF